jgi:hypothetical protein
MDGSKKDEEKRCWVRVKSVGVFVVVLLWTDKDNYSSVYVCVFAYKTCRSRDTGG